MVTPASVLSTIGHFAYRLIPSFVRRPLESPLSRFVFRLTWGLLLPLAIVVVPVLSFVFRSTVRDRALESLGYGLAPVALLVVAFAFAVRYRRRWIKPYWRIWVGSVLATVIALGILSMFYTSEGVLSEASFGGDWGQYFGGTPKALGVLKVVVLALLSPLVLYPRFISGVYKRAVVKAFRAGETSARWTAEHPGRYLRDLTMRTFSRIRQSRQERASERTASPSFRRSWSGGITRAHRSTRASTIIIPASALVPDMGQTGTQPPKSLASHTGWQLPSMQLLSKGQGRPASQAVLQELARQIENTLAEHRVDVAVLDKDIRSGPRVIRFGLVPGWTKKSKGDKTQGDYDPSPETSRVKVQSILAREKDLALALKTPYLRIEAPVPGEALVGLEVPHPQARTVVLRSIAESDQFTRIAKKGGLPVALGEDTGGEPVAEDLSGLPHLLIAGATGSGKSVCINSVVASLLLANGPDQVRMLMVDPKRVELTPFNGIPHLIAPVIVDTDQVLSVLKGTQNEMIRRYKLMEDIGVRNIEGYNQKSPQRLPFLVVIIDELADLMMAAAFEVERALVRIAQLGRATGIHLILATQRPSVNVVTGLLKANIPARIAFAVASQIDSRVILDAVGAEKLLSKGDMLLLSPQSPKPLRVQGTYVHDRDIQRLVEFWKAQTGPPPPDVFLDDRPGPDLEDSEDDNENALLDQARELAERYQTLSASVLQRRLQIGYAKAKTLLEQLEDEGLVHGASSVTTGAYTSGDSPGF